MTKPARSKDEIAAIKHKILQSALAILSEEGYGALTMRRIAARLDMTAANIYNYFHNKDEIYLALVVQGFEILHESLERAIAAENDPAARIAAVMDAYYGFSRNYGQHYDIMFTLPTPKYDDYAGTPLESKARIEMDLSERIVVMLVGAVMDAGLPRREAELAMIEGWTLLHGLVSLKKSRVLQYVAADIDGVYASIRNQILVLVGQKTRR